MDHLVRSAQVGIFIPEGVVCMGIAGEDLFHLITVQYLDVHHCLHLVEHLIARPPGHIPAGGFLHAQHGIGGPQVGKDLHKRPGNLLVAVIKGPCTAHPVKVLRLLSPGGHVCHDRDFHFNLPGLHSYWLFTFMVIPSLQSIRSSWENCHGAPLFSMLEKMLFSSPGAADSSITR